MCEYSFVTHDVPAIIDSAKEIQNGEAERYVTFVFF